MTTTVLSFEKLLANMSKDDFKVLTDNDLITLASKVQAERNRRKEENKGKLIENFKKAFQALRDEDIDVIIYDDYVTNVDSFEFR